MAGENNKDWDLAKASAKKVLGLLRKGKWHPANRYPRPPQPKRLDALPAIGLCYLSSEHAVQMQL